MKPETVTGADLRLGDVVATLVGTDEPWGQATVIGIEDDHVDLFRPYITTSDFSYGSVRVIPYIGIEQYWIWKTTPVIRLRKGDVTR